MEPRNLRNVMRLRNQSRGRQISSRRSAKRRHNRSIRFRHNGRQLRNRSAGPRNNGRRLRNEKRRHNRSARLRRNIRQLRNRNGGPLHNPNSIRRCHNIRQPRNLNSTRRPRKGRTNSPSSSVSLASGDSADVNQMDVVTPKPAKNHGRSVPPEARH
jgi:hypothetical protein